MSLQIDIGRLVWEVSLPEGTDVAAWQEKALRFIEEKILRLLERRIQQLGDSVGDLRIEKLEIDLNEDIFKDFGDSFLMKLDEKIGESIRNIITKNGDFTLSSQQLTQSESDVELVHFFLKAGYLPWWAQAKADVKFNEIIQRLIKNDPLQLADVLRDAIDNEGRLLRFIRHVSDETLLSVTATYLKSFPELSQFNTLLSQQSLLKEEAIKRCVLNFALRADALRLNDSQRAAEVAAQFVNLVHEPTEMRTEQELISLIEALSRFNQLSAGNSFSSQMAKRKRFKLNQRFNKSAAQAEADRADMLRQKKQLLELSFALFAGQKKEIEIFIKKHPALTTYSVFLADNLASGHTELLRRMMSAFSDKEQELGGLILAFVLSSEISDVEKLQWFHQQKLQHPFVPLTETISTLNEQLQSAMRKQSAAHEETVEPEKKENKGGSVEKLSSAEALPREYTENNVPPDDHERSIEQILDDMEENFKYTDEEIFINNAGLVILHPFLIPFYNELGYLEGNKFKTESFRHRAVYILHFLATGTEAIPDEHELVLPKLICGVDLDEVLEPFDGPTEKERGECINLLNSVVLHWTALKNTSAAGLRSTFIARLGRLSHNNNGWTLRIERLALDILLDRIPWGFSVLKNAWNREVIFVEW